MDLLSHIRFGLSSFTYEFWWVHTTKCPLPCWKREIYLKNIGWEASQRKSQPERKKRQLGSMRQVGSYNILLGNTPPRMLGKQLVTYRQLSRLPRKHTATVIRQNKKQISTECNNNAIMAKQPFFLLFQRIVWRGFSKQIVHQGARCVFISFGPLKDDKFAKGNKKMTGLGGGEETWL